jgi:hypothetical protein
MLFYAIAFKKADLNIIMDTPGLNWLDAYIHTKTSKWRYTLTAKNMVVEEPVDFLKSLSNEPAVYAFLCTMAADNV